MPNSSAGAVFGAFLLAKARQMAFYEKFLPLIRLFGRQKLNPRDAIRSTETPFGAKAGIGLRELGPGLNPGRQ